MANVEFKSVDRGAARIKRELERAKNHFALIGIPGDAKRPVDENGQDAGINMAELALIMEKGSPANKVPARPFMRKTRIRAQGRFASLMKNMYRQLLHGKGGRCSSFEKARDSLRG